MHFPVVADFTGICISLYRIPTYNHTTVHERSFTREKMVFKPWTKMFALEIFLSRTEIILSGPLRSQILILHFFKTIIILTMDILMETLDIHILTKIVVIENLGHVMMVVIVIQHFLNVRQRHQQQLALISRHQMQTLLELETWDMQELRLVQLTCESYGL